MLCQFLKKIAPPHPWDLNTNQTFEEGFTFYLDKQICKEWSFGADQKVTITYLEDNVEAVWDESMM